MTDLVSAHSLLSWQPKKRYIIFDFLRGLGIIGFLIQHLVYDLSILNLLFSDYYQVIEANPNIMWIEQIRVFCYKAFFSSPVLILESLFSVGFLVISGISTAFTKRSLRHGIIVFISALCLTGASYIGSLLIRSDTVIIYFGILHCIGLSLIITGVIDIIARGLKKKVHPSFFMYLGFLVVIVGVFIKYIYGYDIDLEDKTIWKIVLGLYVGDADWFPIFPFCGFLFIGVGIGRLIIDRLQNNKKEAKPRSKIIRAIAYPGRHSLIIYIVHQLIYIPIITVVMVCLGFHVR